VVVGEEEFIERVAPWLMIVGVIAYALAVGIILYDVINYIVHGPPFRVCDSIIYMNNSTIPVRLYYAWSPELMKEGYKDKDSYDFLNRGAAGMLFIVNYSSNIGITMKGARLPLVAVLYVANESVVEGGTFPKLISIDSIYLEPGREYALLRPVYAFVEYSPEFFDRYLNGAIHILEIKDCR